MSNITVPYKKIQIPSRGDSPAKTIHAPILKTSLFHNNKERLFFVDSLVDSGADFCVFPANAGKAIGLDVYEGENVSTFGIGGKETLYFHKLTVEVIVNDQSWKFECRAGFSTKLNPIAFNQKAKMFRLKEY